MKADLDSLIEMLRRIYRVIELVQLPDRARLYLELQIMFESYRTASESAKQAILAAITTLADELKIKKSKTTESVRLTAKPDVETLVTEIVEVNRIIGLHNQKTSGFEEVRNEATQKLKDHYLSTIFDEVKELDVAIANLQSDSELLISEIGALKKCIAENMAKVSSKHKACEIINEKLATFLGHHELTFVPNTEDGLVTGYRIMHGQRPAIYLSEGEKTAIAFVYFVVHLGDQEFDVKDGVIVVDDPISSLDSNSLYQAFSFLKNAVKDGGQVFILTHSFDFLKLLMNWRRSGGGAGYYMIKNRYEGDTRCAYIDKMDKELCEFESEYHYLFKLLKQLRDEQDDSIAKAYPVPNIARKVWDTFLMFRVPNGKTPYKKMEELKDAGFDEQKLDAIYKFTNDQSHITGAGFNPALVPEVKKVVKEMFEMMAAVAPEHFAIIDKATI
jgi:wobble nucleotide-excising tRNase